MRSSPEDTPCYVTVSALRSKPWPRNLLQLLLSKCQIGTKTFAGDELT